MSVCNTHLTEFEKTNLGAGNPAEPLITIVHALRCPAYSRIGKANLVRQADTVTI